VPITVCYQLLPLKRDEELPEKTIHLEPDLQKIRPLTDSYIF